jgi:chromosome segregation ATPase
MIVYQEVPSHTVDISVSAGKDSGFPGASTISIILGTTVAIVGAVMTIRKRLSHDSLGISRDRSEQNLMKSLEGTIKSLREERDKANAEAAEAWSTRTEDAKKIAKLESKVEYLEKRENDLAKKLERMYKAVQKYAPPDVRQFLDDIEEEFEIKVEAAKQDLKDERAAARSADSERD